MCPRFDSWWHHRKDFFIYEEVFLFYISRLVLIEQRAGGSEFLALRPRFDSWWHHRKDFFVTRKSFFVLVEQRTGFLNSCPCVPGSIPGGTTEKASSLRGSLFFCVSRAKDWILEFLPLRPRFDSWWHHRNDIMCKGGCTAILPGFRRKVAMQPPIWNVKQKGVDRYRPA